MIYQVGDRILDRWEVRKVLRGGQGEVYILYDHQDRVSVVAKTPRDDAARKEVAAKRFLQEARTWIHLDDHPNIVRAFFVETIAERPFLFLEYVAGGTLAEWINPRMTLPAALGYAIQFCRGMEHAYTRGMKVHRDIKPQNCLMTPDGTLKISDFGLVRVLEQDDTAPGAGLTRVGSVLGTPMYLAPEQFLNSSGVDVRADIYSAGVMFYEVMAGHTPFRAELRDAKKWFQLHLYSPVPKLDGMPAAATPFAGELDELLGHCMAKNPEMRPKSFAEIRAVLEDIYARASGEVYPALTYRDTLSAGDLCNKAFSLGELGRTADEAVLLEQVLNMEPSTVDDWIQRGGILARLGRHEGARGCFAQATLLNRAVSTVGRQARRQSSGAVAGEPGDEAAIAKPRKTMALPRQLDARDPRQVETLLSIARLFSECHRAQEALPYLERVLTNRPDLPAAWQTQAMALSALGRPDEALASLDKALSLDGQRGDLWLERGIMLTEMGRFGEALESLRQSVRLDETPQAWFRMGHARFENGEPDEALACYERAARLDPDNAEIWSHRGMALAKSGSFSEAMICFSEADRLGDQRAGEAMVRMQALMSEADLDARIIHG